MKLDKLVGERFKEKPADCVIDSQALMVRGGYIKYVSSGIYSSYHVLRRITRKIEQIIREEMDAVDGQEVSFPVVLPASLWMESGRYDSVGVELARFSDRNDNPMLIAMTHEEAAVQLVREYGNSYTRFPFMVYQIQTKYRGEARPKGGLMRVREFTMKDAYSFHASQEDFDGYYQRCHEAYMKIFARAGVPEVVPVFSDSGMMGGKVAHEYMLLSPVGEDTVVVCGECDYHANLEAAECIVANESAGPAEPLTLVETPGMKTIADVCDYLSAPIKKSCKAVIYQKKGGEYVVVFVRGDLEVNEIKLKNYLREDVFPAEVALGSGLCPGYIGPHELNGAEALLDSSLAGIESLVCGANKEGFHYTGFNAGRDCPGALYGDFAQVAEGGVCPSCKKESLAFARGLEVGHIFQLGIKYTKSMGMQFADKEGALHYPIMGCYGIGVGRLAASVCEARHDEYGPIWPMSIAPWQVHLCCVRSDDSASRDVADFLYAEFQKSGVEIVYDDRQVSAGVMFSDADLLGVPLRVVVSPRNLKEGVCELSARDKSYCKKIETVNIVKYVLDLINIHS